MMADSKRGGAMFAVVQLPLFQEYNRTVDNNGYRQTKCINMKCETSHNGSSLR